MEAALDRIPDEFLSCLENVAVTVEDEPSDEILREMDVPEDETLLGAYLGVPVGDRSFFELPALPDRIVIFKNPLEEYCETEEELIREIETTVVHEVAHHFGIDEDTLAEYGYD